MNKVLIFLLTKGRNRCGAQKCAAHRLHRLTHERPGADSPSAIPDTALMQRPWQGTRESDGQERAGRLTASLIGTWAELHRSGNQSERDGPRSPCRTYGGARG
jgi:hypothetical protein